MSGDGAAIAGVDAMQLCVVAMIIYVIATWRM